MNFKVTALPHYVREAKRLTKKFPSLKKEIEELLRALVTNPQFGTPIGRHCYKIRLAISSKGAGKSGGARVITCVIYVSKTVYLLSIYDKAEQSDITLRAIKELLKAIPE